MSIYDDLEDILTEEQGEDVSAAIVDAIRELENNKYPTAGTRGNRITITNDAYGVNIKHAIYDALKKLAAAPYYTVSNIVRLSQEEYDALSEYEDVLYGVINEDLIYISELDETYGPTGVVVKVNRLRDVSTFFDTHSNLDYHVEIGRNIQETYLEESLFYGAQALHSIAIPNGFTELKTGCFANSSLYDISLPDTITSIGDYVFSNTALVSIDIPRSVVTIGENAFESCSGLTAITIHAIEDSISGAPWGADASVNIKWVGGE